MHQAARLCQSPRQSHTNAVHRIVRYLIGSKDEALILNPKNEVFECYADADFCGLWDKERAKKDPSIGRSRTGYVIQFAECPIIWGPKLQTEFAMSSTEAEYIALSTALRQVIPLMQFLEEMKK